MKTYGVSVHLHYIDWKVHKSDDGEYLPHALRVDFTHEGDRRPTEGDIEELYLHDAIRHAESDYGEEILEVELPWYTIDEETEE